MQFVQSVWVVLLVLWVNVKSEKVVSCNATNSCPEDMPCCSQFGQCGTGDYCLGGCNPRFSYNNKACMAMPICKNKQFNFGNNYASKVLKKEKYMGNASQGDWAYSGYLMDYSDEDSMLLAMPKNSGGTVLSSTRYIWYGKISAKLKTSHRDGVVTAFILFSDVQDEIDNEWIGADLDKVQTNYYFEGVLNYTHGHNISTKDTFSRYHTYEIDWKEDKLTWSVDGKVGRTLHKNDTYNHTTKRYMYPQTPSRIQISLWPGGNETSSESVKEWAGGEIDWDAPDIKENGYYYMTLNELNVTCYDPPKFAKHKGSSAYSYTNSNRFLAEDVAITDDETMLYSYKGSGLEPKLGKQNGSSKAVSSTSSKLPSGASTLFFQNIKSTGSKSIGKNGANVRKPGALAVVALVLGYII